MVQIIVLFSVSSPMIFIPPICHVKCKGNWYAWLALLSNTPDFMERGCGLCTPPPAAELTLRSDISKLECTGQKVDNLRNYWAYVAVFGLILKWKSHAIA